MSTQATAAEDQESLSADLAEAVAGLELLDDEDLWRAARTRLPSGHHDELEALNFKLQSEGLTDAELLKERGYDITELRGVK